MTKINILKVLGVLLMASAASFGELGCRSGSKRFCGELDTRGPHCLLCLRELWKEVGCEPEGRKSPDNDPVSITTWNSMSVAEVLKNMKEYPGMADIAPLFCYGPERKNVTSAIPDQQTDAKSAPVTSDQQVTISHFISTSIWLPGTSSGDKTGGVQFNSTNANSDLPNETTRTAIICVSVAGGLLALGSALAIYAIYRNRKIKRSQNKGTDDDLKMT